MDVWRAIILTIKEIFQTILVSLLIFLFVYVFLVQPHRVKGDSMRPNFVDGELLLTEKVTYRIYKPQRGDVVVFRAPTARKVDFIKRIVALPGERVEVEDGRVYINDERLNESYETQETGGDISITLSENQYFVLGDNRGSSSDSRSFGPIFKSSIRGRAWLVYWPIYKSQNSGGIRIIGRVNYSISDTFYDR